MRLQTGLFLLLLLLLLLYSEALIQKFLAEADEPSVLDGLVVSAEEDSNREAVHFDWLPCH